MKYIALFVVCLIGNQLLFSQEFAIEGGYKYLESNRFQIGFSYRLSDTRSAYPTNVSSFLTTNFSNRNSFGLAINQRIYHYLEISGTISNRYFEPSIGFNLLNLVKINTGYSISKNQNFQGITFGLLFAIGEDKYYDHLKLGF